MGFEVRAPSNLEANYDYKVIKVEHPKIAGFIALTWGTLECTLFIKKLVTDTRGHSRHGFEKHVLHSLLALDREHERLYPNLLAPPPKTKHTAWLDTQ